MVENNLTSLTINSILIGLFVLGLVASYVLMTNNEGRGQIFDDYPEIEEFHLDLQDKITNGSVVNNANINSNLSARYNPEIGVSGADQSGNAININLQNLISVVWSAILVMGGFVFGNIFYVISGVILAVLGYLVVYYSIKFIRTGT